MKKRYIFLILSLLVIGILVWLFIRPMNIFIVTEAFERPIDTQDAPAMFNTLGAEECGQCHKAIYKEWKTTIHSQAWTDPYFQVDWRFDGSAQVCKNCHTPLDRQQEHLVLGFRDEDKWDPIIEFNPGFDLKLQHEGVTCSACHYRDGKILGVLGDKSAPHPVAKVKHPNQICVRCHVVSGDRWDTFFRFPPCGTVAVIQTSRGIDRIGNVGELTVDSLAALGCVDCHMPLTNRPLAAGGKVRLVRQHLWRGGHDPEMVKKALAIRFEETTETQDGQREYTLSIINTGAAHYLPTGTPDRHLSVTLTMLDAAGNTIKQEKHLLIRTVMWWPFMVDLWDTRLPRGEIREYSITTSDQDQQIPVSVEAVVRYHLVDEARRKRIGYENVDPIAYEVFKESRLLTDKKTKAPALASNRP